MAVFPLAVVAIITAVPLLTAVTTPLVTVAMAAFEDDHVTVLSVALGGVTVATSVYVPPIVKVNVVVFTEMPSVEMSAGAVVSVCVFPLFLFPSLSLLCGVSVDGVEVSVGVLFPWSQLAKIMFDNIIRHSNKAIDFLTLNIMFPP